MGWIGREGGDVGRRVADQRPCAQESVAAAVLIQRAGEGLGKAGAPRSRRREAWAPACVMVWCTPRSMRSSGLACFKDARPMGSNPWKEDRRRKNKHVKTIRLALGRCRGSQLTRSGQAALDGAL